MNDGVVPGVHAVILAAGLGSRLGSSHPKCLTPLSDGRTILQRQLNALDELVEPDRVRIVVGYRKHEIIQAHPSRHPIVNTRFATSNTAWSLATALAEIPQGPVLWLNGDVVFDVGLVDAVRPWLLADRSFVCVNTAEVGEEEVKYTVDDDGMIVELSKGVTDGLGEAIGINFVSSADRPLLERTLARCQAHDYFERGIECAISMGGMRVMPLDVSVFDCIEVDFVEDLERARAAFPGAAAVVTDDARR